MKNKDFKEIDMDSIDVGLIDNESNFLKGTLTSDVAERRMTDLERIEAIREDNLREWITYFRRNPTRFVEEYLGITFLSYWQKYILHMMFFSSNATWIASRGASKTFLTWLYCIVRCILYPGTQFVMTSTSAGMAIKLMTQKVNEFREGYPNIDAEIKDMKITNQNAGLVFHNGSEVFIAPPNENAVGFRANGIIIDEYRKVDDNIIKKVFRPFLTSARRPPFLFLKNEKGENIYKDYPEEDNIEIYISSQAPTYEQAYVRYVNAVHNMIRFDKYLALCTPYYLPVRDGIITKNRIISELQDEGADMSVFALEYECVPYGSSNDAFFTNEMFTKNRVLEKPFIPMTSTDFIKHNRDLSKNPFYMKKVSGEKRILCVDSALAGQQNSANTIVHCMRLIPKEISRTSRREGKSVTYKEMYYEKHVVSTHNITGDLSPANQSKEIKRLFYLFEADTVVIDAQGLSLGVVYALLEPVYDEEYDITYQAYDSINDEVIKSYGKEPINERLPVIYGVKISGASAIDMQHRYNTYTKTELVSGRVKLLKIESDGESYLSRYCKYDEQNAETQAQWISQYRQCDALIAEAVNLEKVMRDSGTKVTLVVPKKSMIKRRDRIIALQYGLLYAQEIEIEDFKFRGKTDLTEYSLGTKYISNKKNASPFGDRKFSQINGFGWRR